MKKLIFFISALLCSLSLYSADINPDAPLKLDPSVVHGKLANGVKFYILKNDVPKNIAIFPNT